jgi:hypothetical protein
MWETNWSIQVTFLRTKCKFEVHKLIKLTS